MHYFCKRPVCTSSFEKSDTKADCFSLNLSLTDNVTGQQPLSDQNNNILEKKNSKKTPKGCIVRSLSLPPSTHIFVKQALEICETGTRNQLPAVF